MGIFCSCCSICVAETQVKIAARLKELCVKLADKGKPVEQKCEELIDDDAEDLMDNIGKIVATELCSDVGACPARKP